MKNVRVYDKIEGVKTSSYVAVRASHDRKYELMVASIAMDIRARAQQHRVSGELVSSIKVTSDRFRLGRGAIGVRDYFIGSDRPEIAAIEFGHRQYRYTDANGVKHYSKKPVPGIYLFSGYAGVKQAARRSAMSKIRAKLRSGGDS